MAHRDLTEEDLSVLGPTEMLRKIFTDVYFGNGKPALTIRVATTEDDISVIQETLKDYRTWQTKMTTLLISVLVSSVGALVAILIELMFRR